MIHKKLWRKTSNGKATDENLELQWFKTKKGVHVGETNGIKGKIVEIF